MKIGNPSITALERAYVRDAMLKGQISQGDMLGAFEEKWAQMNNRAYGVSCNSGTSALELALLALHIGPGDEVIVPEYTMVACAFAVSNCGATPVFVDCSDDLTMALDKLVLAVSPRTKAIMVVPIYGRPVDDLIYELALKQEIPVVEDFAEAHGIVPKGAITCYSFQANKIITTGEGGMCLTDDEFLADEIRKLSALYFDAGRTMLHNRVAHNYRMTNLQAAIGYAQCLRFEELKEKRLQIAEWYYSHLPGKYMMPPREVVWVYDIDCIDEQEAVIERLAKAGIETRLGFKPMSMQPMYWAEHKHLNAYKWSKRIIYLPTYFDLTEDDVKEVSKHL